MKEILNINKNKCLPDFNIREIEWKSASMKKVIKIVPKIAQSKSRVLINGETGTGKTMIAKMIHNYSELKHLQFFHLDSIFINESEFDGKTIVNKKETFNLDYEARAIGTLFLRNVEQLNLDNQYKIFSLIKKWDYENRKFRVIASCKKDISGEINSGNFIDELYYYLNVIHVHIPPLRERPEDIEPLVTYLSKIICSNLNRKTVGFEAGEIEKLHKLDLKGNNLEVANIVERTIVLSPESIENLTFSEHYLADFTGENFNHRENKIPDNDFSTHKDNFLKKTIMEAIKRNSGIKKEAAKNLGMSQRALSYYISKYNI